MPAIIKTKKLTKNYPVFAKDHISTKRAKSDHHPKKPYTYNHNDCLSAGYGEIVLSIQ